MPPMHQLALSPLRIVRWLTAAATLLVLASMVGQLVKHVLGHDTVFGLVPLFYVDAENNIPSYFSASLLLIAAALLGVIAAFKARARDVQAARWTVLAFVFLYLSVDEAASIHEMLTEPTRQLLGGRAGGIFYFAWVVPGTAVALVFALYFLKLLADLPAKIRRLFVVAGAMFLGGAIGMELIGGRYFEANGEDLTYTLIATVEESLEMAGALVFISALMQYIAETYEEARFTFRADPPDAGAAAATRPGRSAPGAPAPVSGADS
jgi:hypothetical protein